MITNNVGSNFISIYGKHVRYIHIDITSKYNILSNIKELGLTCIWSKDIPQHVTVIKGTIFE